MHRLFALLALLLLAPAAHAAESTAVTSPRATVTLISETDSVLPGQPYRVALRIRMAPGWHTYWRNPGDAGVTPEIAFTLPPGVTAGPIAWPTPHRQPEDRLMTFGYDGELVLPLTISGGPGPVTAEATWLVCANVCVPEEGKFSLDLPAGPPAPSAQAALFKSADAHMPRPAPWPARIAPDGVLRLDGEELGPDSVADAWFMPATPDTIAPSAPQRVDISAGKLALAMQPGTAFKPATGLAGVLVLRDRAGTETAYDLAAAPGPLEADAAPFWPRILALAFLGGMFLNLMPCVFPVLAMKAMALTCLAGQAHAEGRRHAASYAAGVMLTFLLVAFALVGLRAAGAAAGWGFQFQSPVFVAAMALILFAVGLNLSGLFAIGGTVGAGQSLAGRQGLAGSFFAGALAVLVATPCTAPFMSVAVTAGLAGSPLATAGVFLSLGAGLAAPYVLLALLPRITCALMPRPGRWMDVLKQALAFPMYGAVVWLVWVVSIQSGPQGVLLVLSGLVLMAFAAWLLGLAQRNGGRIGRVLAAVAVLAALGLTGGLNTVEGAVPVSGAEPFTAARLAELRAAGKPVFVNMTAAWCVSCLVNERVALSRDTVHAAFATQGITYLKGDWTRQDAAITAYLRSQGADGVPLYVFYPPGAGAAVHLPQVLTPGIVLAAIKP